MTTAEYREIPVSGGEAVAKVSLEDYGYLREVAWFLAEGYAVGNWHGKHRSMHRVVMEVRADTLPPNRVVDHINRDRLDNRRENLRWVTTSENNANRTVTAQPRLHAPREVNANQSPFDCYGDILGTKEVADLLGWSSGRVSVYHGRGRLPAPVQYIAAGPIWRRQDILRYADEHKVGRPDDLHAAQEARSTPPR